MALSVMKKIKDEDEDEKDEVITGNRNGITFKTTKSRTTTGGIVKPYKYTKESIDTTGYSKGKAKYELKSEEGEGDKVSGIKVTKEEKKEILKKDVPTVLESLKKQ